MEGTYNIFGSTITDPEIDYYFVGRNIVSGMCHIEILVRDTQDLENSAPLNYEVPDEPTEWDMENIEPWVENYLQQYRV